VIRHDTHKLDDIHNDRQQTRAANRALHSAAWAYLLLHGNLTRRPVSELLVLMEPERWKTLNWKMLENTATITA